MGCRIHQRYWCKRNNQLLCRYNGNLLYTGFRIQWVIQYIKSIYAYIYWAYTDTYANSYTNTNLHGRL